MLDSWPVILMISSTLGFLAGVGVGGGSLLILWLTLVLNMAHSDARVMNLLFFIPSAVIASLFRWKQGQLDFKKVLPAILVGCISAGIFSMIGRQVDTDNIKKLFGVLLLGTGVRELLFKPKSSHPRDKNAK